MRAIFLAALAPALFAASNRLSPSDAFQLELVADPQISPDGKRVVYVRQFADLMTDRNYSNLWIVDFDGSNHRPLTTGNYSDTSPRWSPDGSRLAYLSDREGSPQIHVRWMDTGQSARITNIQQPPSGINWSPDGKWISLVVLVPSPAPKIADVMPAPPGAKWADPPVIVNTMTYRFDQAGYLKPGYHHLFVVPAEGGTPRQISSGDFQHGGPGLRGGGDAVWTPDGRSLIVSLNRRSPRELEPLDTEIYEYSVADGSMKQLTRRKGPDGAPAVSPDGKLIAYLGFDDRYQGYQITRLHVMNRDGSGARAISKLDRDIAAPRWSADGRGLFAMYDEQGNTKLALHSLDGSVRTLTGDIGGRSASGGGTYSVSRTGAFALTYSRPTVPADVGVGSLDNPKVRVITAVNEDLLAGKRLGEVEEIWYESSLDKRRIHGWIIKPPEFDSTKKYPLVLEIHGGPFANYGDRFDMEKQVWAAKDYVVLYTNPRGSTSYGEEFGNLIHHKYPGDDFYDLNSGVDAVLVKGYIDPKRLYVTGGSGGGVLTCWMIGRTPRFRAAATIYPVINWYSFVLTADISAFVARYWFPGMPWDHVDHYEKRSLLSVVKNVKTPTLVMTGEEDYRTPMSESEQYYQALQLLGVDTALVRVPGEPHGIRRRPSHWMAKMAHVAAWFEKYK
jgi:dipeptidyl aminopeptidase/acylaminoacyl peptidase